MHKTKYATGNQLEADVNSNNFYMSGRSVLELDLLIGTLEKKNKSS